MHVFFLKPQQTFQGFFRNRNRGPKRLSDTFLPSKGRWRRHGAGVEKLRCFTDGFPSSEQCFRLISHWCWRLDLVKRSSLGDVFFKNGFYTMVQSPWNHHLGEYFWNFFPPNKQIQDQQKIQLSKCHRGSSQRLGHQGRTPQFGRWFGKCLQTCEGRATKNLRSRTYEESLADASLGRSGGEGKFFFSNLGAAHRPRVW